MASKLKNCPAILCSKSRKCSKNTGHLGKCNSERKYNTFWKKSPFFQLRTSQGNLSKDIHQASTLLDAADEELLAKRGELDSLVDNVAIAESTMENSNNKLVEQEKMLNGLSVEYEKVKTVLDQKGFSRTRRKNTPTTLGTVTSYNSSMRYRRRQETKNALEYVHGGEEGALLGAWDFFAANASEEMINTFIGKYKRGKYIEGVINQAMEDFHQSEESLTQAVFFKYKNFLSRRKFNVLCKTQSSVFDADNEVWVPRNVKCLGIDMQLSLNRISNESVEKFVKTLDIGGVSQIPNVPGVTRTVTGIVFMIIDLHLRLPHLCRRLVWFNDNTNHFVFQFLDDGAPETSTLTMSIGSLTFWNLGERVRSREFQYLLHCVSLGEKHDVLELLWQQHTEEMLLLESSVFTICGKECTMQFQPSADMSWQSWACNELNQAATYPSPYANVHKRKLSTMGGSIGFDGNLWKPYVNDDREKHLDMVNVYLDTLPKGVSERARHEKKLEFMASHGIRQLGKPRIGIFADRVKPDPLHCEINAWQHLLDLLYHQSVQNGIFDVFVKTLSAPAGLETAQVINQVETNSATCTAGDPELNVSGTITEKSASECSTACSEGSEGSVNVDEGENNISPGIQRQFSLLELQKTAATENMSNALKKAAIAPSCNTPVFGCGLAYLAGKIEEHYQDETKRFNKLSIRLIGDQAYAIPYHARKLYNEYKIGFGILSLQAKESKHAGLKGELSFTNRSNESTSSGKWWQVMRSDYIRSFYLPEHQPSPPSYTSHFKSRTPPHCNLPTYCDCGRKKEIDNPHCDVCIQSLIVLDCAQQQKLSAVVVAILKPIVCSKCNKRFADDAGLKVHFDAMHAGATGIASSSLGEKSVKSMSVEELKKVLRVKGLSTSGRKDILVRRLEGALAGDS